MHKLAGYFFMEKEQFLEGLNSAYQALGSLYSEFEDLLERDVNGEDVSRELQICSEQIAIFESREAELSGQIQRSRLKMQPEESEIALNAMRAYIDSLHKDS